MQRDFWFGHFISKVLYTHFLFHFYLYTFKLFWFSNFPIHRLYSDMNFFLILKRAGWQFCQMFFFSISHGLQSICLNICYVYLYIWSIDTFYTFKCFHKCYFHMDEAWRVWIETHVNFHFHLIFIEHSHMKFILWIYTTLMQFRQNPFVQRTNQI